MHPQRYVFGSVDDDAERTRLRLLEAWADAQTLRCLGEIGVRPGWRCLEVAAGAGSVARWLAGEVGPSGTVVASEYDVGGTPGWSTPGGGSFTGPIISNSAPTPDPLRNIPEPDPSTMTVRSTKKLTHSSAQTITLSPGVYIGGISITGKGNVILQPGIYYMQGGGFSDSGQGTLTGTGVMIYNAPTSNSDNINLSGTGAITLTPPTSGVYQGISIFQQRDATVQPSVNVSGNGTAPLQISGTFYVPGGLLSVTGNGTQDTIGSQYISDTLTLGGNGSFNVSWDPNLIPGIRQCWLVE